MALRQARRGLPALRMAAPLVSLHTSASTLQEAKVPAAVPLSKLKDSFNDGTSITYLEELEKRYKSDPNSVDRTWASFFRSLGGCGGRWRPGAVS